LSGKIAIFRLKLISAPFRISLYPRQNGEKAAGFRSSDRGTPKRKGNPMLKTMIRSTAIVSIVLASSFAAQAKNPMVGGAAMYKSKNIVENAVNSKDHTTLVAAVKAAGLVETLEGKGPFTVFAPTNEAFAALPAGTVETLLKPENKAQLTKILTCHVVAADAMSKAISKMIKDDGGMHKITTVGGCVLTATKKGKKIMLKDEAGDVATVTIADVQQSNGVIHVINKVLLPKA
jgi:uncharacterized surface protein with fasciclin (FAS1) repeats